MVGTVWRRSGSADAELCAARQALGNDDEFLRVFDAMHAGATRFADGAAGVSAPGLGPDGTV